MSLRWWVLAKLVMFVIEWTCWNLDSDLQPYYLRSYFSEFKDKADSLEKGEGDPFMGPCPLVRYTMLHLDLVCLSRGF